MWFSHGHVADTMAEQGIPTTVDQEELISAVGLNRNVAEQMVATCRKPELCNPGANAERTRVIVQVVKHSVDQLWNGQWVGRHGGEIDVAYPVDYVYHVIQYIETYPQCPIAIQL